MADAGAGQVKEILAAGGSTISIGSGFSVPTGVAVDAIGNVYECDAGNNNVYIIPAGGGSTVTIGSLSEPGFNAVDGSGNVYVTSGSTNSVNEIKPVGGYYISPALPAGLSFNATTGIISGTPTSASPQTPYVITAYNSAGRSQYSVNIGVINPVTISYSSPKTYGRRGHVNAACAEPSSGVAAAGYSSSAIAIGVGF